MQYSSLLRRALGPVVWTGLIVVGATLSATSAVGQPTLTTPPPPPPSPSGGFQRPPAAQDFGRYRLGPGDTLLVNVVRFPDLSVEGTVDVEGNIFVPLVGAISVQGLTIPQARNQIRLALDRYIINPQVDLVLVNQRAVRVSILGEVVRPGAYPLENAQLSAALVEAGGTTSYADLRRVRVRRISESGAAIERTIDLYSPLLSSSSLPELQLEDGDTLVVPALTVENRHNYDSNLVARTNLAQTEIRIRVLDYSASRGGGNVRGQALSIVTLPNGSTFLDAIATVSPNPDTASLGSIALVRFDPAEGNATTQELSARQGLRGDASQNPVLQHNDVIIVGRNTIGRVLYGLNTITQPFRDVAGFLLFFDTLDRVSD
ncbi:polysaccharide biosynthesis/export family protein [Leptolyngbya sp. AN02str]|uniref:polysaccharide biosynthesis/export family protein n=1 Tax=Leptolyngbya sp. AN02str TaxID=3423363 RepID=UPI003D31D787